MVNNDELQHYGVIGMKWGVRRYQNKNGSLTSAGKKRVKSKRPSSYLGKKLDSHKKLVAKKKKIKMKVNKEAEAAKTNAKLTAYEDRLRSKKIKNHKKKESEDSSNAKQKISSMSNEELQAAINRLSLEKRYSELTAQPVKGPTPAQKFIRKQVADVADIALKKIANKALDTALNNATAKKAAPQQSTKQQTQTPNDKPKPKQSQPKRETVEPDDIGWNIGGKFVSERELNKMANQRTSTRSLGYTDDERKRRR